MTSLNLKDGEAIRIGADGEELRRRRWKDEHGNIIPDGVALHVPVMMMDSKPKGQPAISNYQVAADAHFARTGMQSRSGSYTPEQQKAREDRQTAYDKRLSDAWKGDNAAAALFKPDLTPGQQAVAEEQAEKDAAERAAKPNADYDRRVSSAYKSDDANAALDAARQRYHQRLEEGYKQ